MSKRANDFLRKFHDVSHLKPWYVLERPVPDGPNPVPAQVDHLQDAKTGECAGPQLLQQIAAGVDLIEVLVAEGAGGDVVDEVVADIEADEAVHAQEGGGGEGGDPVPGQLKDLEGSEQVEGAVDGGEAVALLVHVLDALQSKLAPGETKKEKRS